MSHEKCTPNAYLIIPGSHEEGRKITANLIGWDCLPKYLFHYTMALQCDRTTEMHQ